MTVKRMDSKPPRYKSFEPQRHREHRGSLCPLCLCGDRFLCPYYAQAGKADGGPTTSAEAGAPVYCTTIFVRANPVVLLT